MAPTMVPTVHRVAAVTLFVGLTILLASCAAGPNTAASAVPADQQAGFLLGLWQRLIIPIAFIVSLFNPNIGIDEIHNNRLVQLRVLLGILIPLSGVARAGAPAPRSPVHDATDLPQRDPVKTHEMGAFGRCVQDHRLCPASEICCLSGTDVPRGRGADERGPSREGPTTRQPQPSGRPLLGVRKRPGSPGACRVPAAAPCTGPGGGWLLGHTFVLVVHAGRRTGQPHAMTAMVLRYDPATSEVVVCANWGPTSDWIRNIRARPALRVQIGQESFAPQHRFLTDEESFAVAGDFRRRHPHRVRFAERVLGWGDLRSDGVLRDFVATRPFVAFRPAPKGFRRPRRTPPT